MSERVTIFVGKTPWSGFRLELVKYFQMNSELQNKKLASRNALQPLNNYHYLCNMQCFPLRASFQGINIDYGEIPTSFWPISPILVSCC